VEAVDGENSVCGPVESTTVNERPVQDDELDGTELLKRPGGSALRQADSAGDPGRRGVCDHATGGRLDFGDQRQVLQHHPRERARRSADRLTARAEHDPPARRHRLVRPGRSSPSRNR